MNHTLKRAFGPCFLSAAFFVSLPASGAELVSATVSHTIRNTTDNGVTKTTEYKERIIRGANDVWVERVLPTNIKRVDEHGAGEKGHKHLDVERAARWISRNSKGELMYRLVDMDHKVVVDIAPGDYSNVGFDGRWDTAYHLVSPAFIKTLKADGSASCDLQRYKKADDARQSVELVWNQRLQMPTSMQFADKAGTSYKKATVAVDTTQTTEPWKAVTKFPRKELSDYLD